MNKFYPINLNLKNQECLVIGGGRIAERKLKRLLEFGAKVTLVSPTLTKKIDNWIKHKKIKFIKNRYSEEFLDNQRLIFATTSSKEINKRIAQDAKEKKLLVNVASPGSASNFILPAIISQKNLLVSISTHGKNPKKTKNLKLKLEKLL